MSPKASRRDVEAARTLVRARDGDTCQMCECGLQDGFRSVHHRVAKGMGGSALLERASNLVSLCGTGNNSGCHGLAHSSPNWARRYGWIVLRSQDPAEIPVLLVDGWYLLADDGSRTPTPSPLLQATGEAV